MSDVAGTLGPGTVAARTMELAAGQHAPLDAAPPFWRVRQGRAASFLDGDRRRHPLETVGEGDILAASVGNMRISVTAEDDLILEPVEATAGPSPREFERWARSVLRSLRSSRPPGAPTVLDPDDDAPLEAGNIVNAGPGFLWVEAADGLAANPLGVEPAVGTGEVIPLGEGVWLRIAASGTVRCLDTAALLRRWRVEDVAARIAEWLPAWLEALDDEREAAALARLGRAEHLSDHAVDRTLRRLVRVGERDEPAARPRGPDLPALVQAAALAIEAGGVAATVGRVRSGASEAALIRTVARQSQVRHRQILLRDEWWRASHEPLVVFEGEERRPLALVPDGAYRFIAHDPDGGEPRVVDAALAETISPTAYSFYRPFDADVRNWYGIVRFIISNIRRELGAVALVGAGAGLIGAAIPLATGFVIQDIIPSGSRNLLVQIGIALGLGSIMMLLFSLAKGIALHRIDGRSHAVLSPAIWDRVLKLPARFFRDYGAGDLNDRIMGLERLRSTISDVLLGSTVTALFSVFQVGLMLAYDWRLALVAIGLVGINVVATLAVGVLQMRHLRRSSTERGRLATLVFQLILGINKLRVADAQRRAFARWGERYADERGAIMRARRLRAMYETFGNSFQLLALTALFAMMGYVVTDGLGTGLFIAFIAAYTGFQAAALDFSRSLLSVLDAVPAYDRARPILEAEPESRAGSADPGELSGAVEVNNVTFGYVPGAPPVLDGVSFSIPPGESVAIVGSSGSGKSTLLRLMLGFETPSEGGIYYDGQDLRSLDTGLVRQQISVVLQGGRVFAGSILDNIRGASDATHDDCVEAARAAGFEDDLQQLPMGLYTPLTEGAPTLSGGQRQRLLIARALAAKPRLIYLDEATSALDNRTQAIVTETLGRLSATRLVIAHRLSTIVDMDRIIVLDGGRVVEQGSFDELMAAKGRFAELAERQMA